MKKANLVLIICISIFLCFVTTGSIVFAKYLGEDNKPRVIASDKFYFFSQTITTSSTLTLFNGGTKTFNIDVNNFLDTLRITEVNTIYSVSFSATNSYTGYMAKKNGVPLVSSTLLGNVASTDTVVIELSGGYIDNTVVTVNIVSSSPYTKTLSMSVTLRTVPASSYYIVDEVESSVCTLYVASHLAIANNTLEIQWDVSELNIDMTSNYYINAPTKTQDVNGFCYLIKLASILANSSFSISFYKTDKTANFTFASTSIVNNSITI